MILEIVGSRILAPWFGTSVVVWTSLIGGILACLSLGYWLGGRLADRRLGYRVLGGVLLAAAMFTGLANVFAPLLLAAIQDMTAGVRLGAITATLALFGVPGVLLGMVLPYVIRLRLHDLEHSGETIGRIYAISTIGSITGTFLAGFVLLAWVGSRNILLVLSMVLLVMAWLALLRDVSRSPARVALLMLVAVLVLAGAHRFIQPPSRFPVDVDTAYQRIWIYESRDPASNRPLRNLTTDPQVVQSSMYLDAPDELVYGYAEFYRLVEHFMPHFSSGLMIGGAGYTYPREYLRRYPRATLDVVEIDPGMTRLARRHFNLEDDPRLVIHHQDGRIFLERNTGRYDVIMVDALRSFYSTPFQLATREAMMRIRERLAPDGVLFVNMIGSIEGENGRFVRAEYATCKAVFPHVYLFPAGNRRDGRRVQNIMLVATRSAASAGADSDDPALARLLAGRWTRRIPTDMPVLSDDFAPVEFYNMAMRGDAGSPR